MKISVIIPTFNRVNSLERSVYSILNQRIDDLEIIIVDDYFEDQTDLIESLFQNFHEVRTIKSNCHSAAGARNLGVSRARGELITFLDDDDIYLPGRLNNMLSFYDKTPEEFSFISSGRFFEINDFICIDGTETQKFGVIELSDVLEKNGIDIGFMMKKNFFNHLGGFDENLNSLEDWDLILRALSIKNGYKLQRLDYVVNSELDRNRVSLSQEKSRRNLAEKYKFTFGKKWYYDNQLIGLYESEVFDFNITMNALLYSRTLTPIKIIIKYIIRILN